MDKKYIVANWKMNGDIQLIQLYQDFFSQYTINHHIVVCPPSPFLEKIKHTSYEVGAQDCHFEKSGAFTGSTSADILKSMNAEYVILGHSERRTQYNETSQLVQKKSMAALDAGLTPIICIGETLQEKETGQTSTIITNQLKESIPNTKQDFMIAYEPIWAIGTGTVPSPEYIQNIHSVIHNIYPTCPVLYGGSVNKKNIKDILRIKYVDGVLVGGASLDISFFQTLA